jgi:hypothetical protein
MIYLTIQWVADLRKEKEGKKESEERSNKFRGD